MAADSDDRSLRREPLPGSRPGRAPRSRVRILFGCTGWPSGVIELASWTEHQQLAEPVIFQLQPGDGPDELFLDRLIEFRPHVVGFRLEMGQLEQIKRLIQAVRRVSDAEIILGGPTATSHPLEVLEDSGADYVFAGEAEKPLSQFLRLAWQRDSNDRKPEIPGLAYRYGGRVYLNTLPADGYERTVLDADGLACCNTLRCLRARVRPATEVELIAANRLNWSLLENFRSRLDGLYFTGGRGCPGACTFCAKLHGNEVRTKSARQLLEEIETADVKVADGTVRLGRWDLLKHVDDPALRERQLAWAAVYDDDFFLGRRRAIEFFRLWADSPLMQRYRISLQTNPRSMLGADGQVLPELLEWIDRLKPMIQLGAESFNPELLARWHKRHNIRQLDTVLAALESTRQDYTVFQLLTDFDSTPEELVETLRLLILNAFRHRRMRIAASPFTIPLYDSDTRRLLEYGGRLPSGRAEHFTDYERPQPGWMDPLTAELAALADAKLPFAINLEQRDGALIEAFEAVLGGICRQPQTLRTRQLRDQAQWAMEQVDEARFQPV
jgi:hypothetical protein